MPSARRPVRSVLALAGLLLAMLVPWQPAFADVSDTIQVVKEGEELTNVEIVARLAEATFTGQTDRVLIGREDNFADNMASSVMQDSAPLLLVPTDGPVSQRVLDLLAEYDPQEIVLLGGEAAISTAVEDALAADYTVTRRFGPTRFETATEIAETEAPEATTAILARAFPAPGSDDASQAFADSLAAGAWSSDRRWPILLTNTDALPDSVEAYLADSSISDVRIMGGTAAISQAVEDRLGALGMTTTRVAGATRFTTAIAVAQARGFDAGADANRVVLVEGQAADAWAGGFAAAAHAAAFDAPVVLSNGSSLPGPTGAFLSGSAFAQAGPVDAVLTCASAPEACEEARVMLGLPPQADVTFTPGSGAEVDAGSTITVDVSVDGTPPVSISGDCVTSTAGAAPGPFSLIVDPAFTGPCTIDVEVALAEGSTQQESATYTVVEAGVVGGIVTDNFGEGEGYTYVPGAEEVEVLIGPDDTYRIDGQAATEAVFFSQLGTGDVVVQSTAFAQDTPVLHDLTNREPDDYTEGVLGNVYLPSVAGAFAGTISNQIAIIEPVSGVPLRLLTLDEGSLYELDGARATLAAVRSDVSEGDRVSVSVDAEGLLTISVDNAAIAGPVFDVQKITTVLFRIDNGGLPFSPNIGDTIIGTGDSFDVIGGSDQVLLVDGVEVDASTFRTEINAGDMVTYARQADVETFALENGVAPTTSGLATETFDIGLGQMTLLYPGEGRVNELIDADATFTVDGLLTTRPDFADRYTAGDQVGIAPATASTPQRISLTNRALQGTVSFANTSDNFYDVSTPDGVLFDTLSYFGDPFGVGQSGHRFFVNNVEVTQVDFEMTLDGVANGQTVTVQTIPGGEPGGGLANEHRLTT